MSQENSTLTDKAKTCRYPFYKIMIESKGFIFYKHESPYDYYSDGKNKLMLCEPCRKLAINDKKINQPGEDILRPLVKFLFNQTFIK